MLASHAQMAFRVNGQTHDFDFIRLPMAIPNKQACTMWPALCAGDGGLWPGLSLVKAKLRAVLVTCDAAPANIKLLNHLLCVLADRTLLLPLLCLQHRTGNVVERVDQVAEHFARQLFSVQDIALWLCCQEIDSVCQDSFGPETSGLGPSSSWPPARMGHRPGYGQRKNL